MLAFYLGTDKSRFKERLYYQFHGQQHRTNSYEDSQKPLKAPHVYTDTHIELFRKLKEDDGEL